jgi:hypothetical protein
MQSSHRRGARRSVRLLLIMTMLAGAVAVIVAGAQPATAATWQWFPDELVVTSERLSNTQTHATLTVRLRRNGDVVLDVRAHCTAKTRKYVTAEVAIRSERTGYQRTRKIYDRRVDSGEWDEWAETWVDDWQLVVDYDQIVNDPGLSIHFRMVADRLP